MTGYARAVAITKSDTVNIDGTTTAAAAQPALGTRLCDAVYCGGAGIIAAVFQDGVVLNFTVIAGQILPVRMVRVNSTNTTATLLNALFND